MSDLDDTIPPPLRPTVTESTHWSPPASSEVVVDAAGMSDRGKVRADNQDHFYLARLGRFSQTIATSLPAGELPERAPEPIRQQAPEPVAAAPKRRKRGRVVAPAGPPRAVPGEADGGPSACA